MKKLFVAVFSLISVLSFGQTATKKTTPTKKPAPPAPALKNQQDSFSYAIGLSIANFYREQGISNLNNTLVVKALNDAKAGKPLLNDQQVNNCIVGYMNVKRSEKASSVKKECEAFLAENAKKPGVHTTATGLQYQVIQEGTGPKPVATDRVKVHYHGTLINGSVFDSSVQRGEPYVLNINEVIPGWVEALQMMPTGSKWKLFIPSHLAYGDNDAGAGIKGGSTLIFDLELLEIVK